MNLTLFKLVITFLKYYVIIASIIMTIHCGLLIVGINLWFIDIIAGISLGGFIAIFITSYLLKMCNLFRMFLIHQFLVSSCISYNETIGFSDDVAFMLRSFMFIAGLFLIMKLIDQNGFESDCGRLSKEIC